jgi:hypothetical protein
MVGHTWMNLERCLCFAAVAGFPEKPPSLILRAYFSVQFIGQGIAWWFLPIIPALGRQRQEDREFKKTKRSKGCSVLVLKGQLRATPHDVLHGPTI